MFSRILNVSVDCADPYRLAVFWSEVLGIPIGEDDVPGDDEAGIEFGDGHLLFLRVPEPKSVKNRLHLCLEPESTRERETERLIDLGATLVDDRRRPDGSGWTVLADPEGNEFCVLRSAAERPAP